MKTSLITSEVEQEIEKLKSNPFAKVALAPLRLFITWMKAVDAKLESMEAVNGE